MVSRVTGHWRRGAFTLSGYLLRPPEKGSATIWCSSSHATYPKMDTSSRSVSRCECCAWRRINQINVCHIQLRLCCRLYLRSLRLCRLLLDSSGSFPCRIRCEIVCDAARHAWALSAISKPCRQQAIATLAHSCILGLHHRGLRARYIRVYPRFDIKMMFGRALSDSTPD